MPNPAVTATPALTSFEIKSAELSLLALLLRTTELDDLDNDLTLRFGDQPDFFDHDPVLVDLSALDSVVAGTEGGSTEPAAIDFEHLAELLRERRLVPVAVKGGTSAQQQQAREAGLVVANDADVQTPGAPAGTPPAATAPTTPPPTAPIAASTTALSALVIDKPLRSGQQVYARGRDLVVLAMVNPGAEVIADGHIHVYAPLRGKAMAGARGNAHARIFALVMEPELLSIAGVYRTSETPLPDAIRGRSAQVYLHSTEQGDKLIMEPLA